MGELSLPPPAAGLRRTGPVLLRDSTVELTDPGGQGSSKPVLRTRVRRTGQLVFYEETEREYI